MNLDYIKEKKELVSVVLLGISALSAILLFVKVTGFLGVSANAQNIVQSAIEHENTADLVAEQYLGNYRESASTLIEDNLFAPPPREPEPTNPVDQISAIWGNEVLIGDRWVSVGETYQNVTIVAIDGTTVTTEWNGIQSTYSPLDIEIASNDQQNGRGGNAMARGQQGSSTIIAGQSNNNNRLGSTVRGLSGMDAGEINRLRTQMSGMMGGRGGQMGGRGAGGFGGGARGGRGGRGG